MISLKTDNWQIDHIDTVLFDKDGTFIDLHYFWGKMTEMRAKAVINQYNLSIDFMDNLCEYLGYNRKQKKMLKDGITALYSRPRIIEIFKNNLLDLNIIATTKDIENIFDNVSKEFYQEIHKYTKPIDDAIKFIRDLYSHGVKLGIVTSDSVDSTMLTLEYYDWEKYFSAVIGRESTKENKESGIPAKKALEIMHSTPNNTIMIGDAPMDYLAAKNAGIDKTILVATGQLNIKDLKSYSNYVVNSLNKIKIIKHK